MYLGIRFVGNLSLEDVLTNYVTHWQVFFGYIPDSPQLTPPPQNQGWATGDTFFKL